MKLGREEFIASHRAKIRIISMRPEPNEEHPISLLMTYVNVGDIDAHVEQFSHRFITAGSHHEKKIAPMSDHNASITLKSGVPETALFVSSNQGDVIVFVAVKAASYAAEFQCVGYIRYTDAGGAERRTGFCFAMTKNGTWEPRPNSDYAYEY